MYKNNHKLSLWPGTQNKNFQVSWEFDLIWVVKTWNTKQMPRKRQLGSGPLAGTCVRTSPPDGRRGERIAAGPTLRFQARGWRFLNKRLSAKTSAWSFLPPACCAGVCGPPTLSQGSGSPAKTSAVDTGRPSSGPVRGKQTPGGATPTVPVQLHLQGRSRFPGRFFLRQRHQVLHNF